MIRIYFKPLEPTTTLNMPALTVFCVRILFSNSLFLCCIYSDDSTCLTVLPICLFYRFLHNCVDCCNIIHGVLNNLFTGSPISKPNWKHHTFIFHMSNFQIQQIILSHFWHIYQNRDLEFNSHSYLSSTSCIVPMKCKC